MAMPDSQQYLWNLYLINNLEGRFTGCLILIISFRFPAIEMRKFVKKPQLKFISF